MLVLVVGRIILPDPGFITTVHNGINLQESKGENFKNIAGLLKFNIFLIFLIFSVFKTVHLEITPVQIGLMFLIFLKLSSLE